MSKPSSKQIIETCLEVEASLKSDNPSAETLDKIRLLSGEDELYIQFWDTLASPQSLPWLHQNGLINAKTLKSKIGSQQIRFLLRAIKLNPSVVDTVLADYLPAAEDYQSSDMMVRIAIEAPKLENVPNLVRKIVDSDFPSEGPLSSYLMGDFSNKLRGESNPEFHKFNLRMIALLGKTKRNKTDGHEIDEYFKDSNQPDLSLADRNLDYLKACCLALIETASEEGRNLSDDLGAHSTLWLTSLNDDGDNSSWDRRAVFCNIIVKFGDRICESVEGGLANVRRVLSGFDFIIFKRIEFHLIGRHGAMSDVQPIISSQENFDNPLIKNEMANLFRQWFGELMPDIKSDVFKWIDAGPSGESGNGYGDHWRLCKLSWISAFLSGERLVQFNKLKERFGPDGLDLADRNHHMSSGWGNTSPYALEELSVLPIDVVVVKINSWAPPEQRGFRSPTVDGLANVFQSLIAANAVAWSKAAMMVAKMKPHFVSRAFNGWMAHARDHADLNWSSLMDLSNYVLSQPSSVLSVSDKNNPPEVGRLDHDWKWTRQNIAELISKACGYSVDIALRARFLAALKIMINDDPSSSLISKEEFFQRDHATDALNSVRGKVATALCDLAVWTAKTDPVWEPNQGQFTGDLRQLADIQGLIKFHFEDADNSNSTTWAAYALRANQLRWLSPIWFEENIISKLNLANAAAGKQAGWSFWLVFLKFQQPHRVWLKAMRPCYDATADWLKNLSEEQQENIEPITAYLEHLMVYYWQGDLDLEPHGLLARAFSTVIPGKRMEAITFVGRSLKRGDAPPNRIVNRFHQLWSWYWQNYGPIDVDTRKGHRHSLFGGWLASGHLGAEWSLVTFLAYLDLDAGSKHGDDELKCLVEWCSEYSALVLRATCSLVIGETDSWRIDCWKESVASILDKTKTVMGADVEIARDALKEALIRRGHLEMLN